MDAECVEVDEVIMEMTKEYGSNPIVMEEAH